MGNALILRNTWGTKKKKKPWKGKMCWSRNVLCFAKLVPSVLVVSQVSDPTATGVSVVPGHESNCNKVCHEFGKWKVALQQGRCCFCEITAHGFASGTAAASSWMRAEENYCATTPSLSSCYSPKKKNLKEHHTIVMRSYNTTMRIWGFSWLGGIKTVTLM